MRFVAGDGCRLPLGDGTVDLITIGYGLRNLPDIPQALAEFYRVARPGGRLLVLDFGKPENRLWGGCYAMYLGVCVPLYGRWFHGDPSTYDYIRESLEHYPAQAGVTTAAAAAGWGTVECRNLLGGIMSIHRAIKPGGRGTASSAGG